jgi:hypothetical protein
MHWGAAQVVSSPVVATLSTHARPRRRLRCSRPPPNPCLCSGNAIPPDPNPSSVRFCRVTDDEAACFGR